MEIRFVDAGSISESHGLQGPIAAFMSKELCRMSFQLVRLEVYLNQEHDQGGGKQRKCCILEAHLMDCEPITIASEASCYTQAVNTAIRKLKIYYISRFGWVCNN